MSRQLKKIEFSRDGGVTWTGTLSLPLFAYVVAEWHRDPADVSAVYARLHSGVVVSSPIVPGFAYRDPDAWQRSLDLSRDEYARLERRGLA